MRAHRQRDGQTAELSGLRVPAASDLTAPPESIGADRPPHPATITDTKMNQPRPVGDTGSNPQKGPQALKIIA
jgi:hypothetical protein